MSDMTEANFRKADDLCGRVLQRACEIVWTHLEADMNHKFAKVTICRDGTAVLSYPIIDSDCDSHYLGEGKNSFSAAALWLSDADFAEWKALKMASYRNNQARQQAELSALAERQERSELQRLKTKYEPNA